MENKSDLRIRLKELRKTFDISAKSRIITDKIRELGCYKSAKKVLLFYPLKYEVNLLGLLEDDKDFYFPRVKGEFLEVCPYDGNFRKSDLNILEPCGDAVNPETLDLAIVPALAVDEQNYRLGYGGGFYDRFLEEFPKLKTLTPIYKECVYKKLPSEPFDKPVDYVVFD